MNIFVESQDTLATDDQLTQRIEEVLGVLKARCGQERFLKLEALAATLLANTPLSYLISPPAELLCEWLEKFLDFIEGRRDGAGVELLPFGGEGKALLLSNSADAPYLLDSIQTVLLKKKQRFQVISHPILSVVREEGAVKSLEGAGGTGPKESFIVTQLEKVGEHGGELREAVREAITAALLVARDSDAMTGQMKALEDGAGDENSRNFWAWLKDDNFIPFSYRSLLLEGEEAREEGPPLGLSEPVFPDPEEELHRQLLFRRGALVVEKTRYPNPLRHPEKLVYLGYCEPLPDGGRREHAFFGTYSPKSVDELPYNVPALRAKVEGAMESLNIPKNSHDYRKIVEIYNASPKAELFFMDKEEMLRAVRSFTRLYRHGAVKIVATHSLALRGLTLLFMMPREFYAPENMGRIETYLCRYFRAPSASSRIIHISSDYLSLHVSLDPAQDVVRIDAVKLEKGLANIVRPWGQKIRLLLDGAYGEREGEALWHKYRKAFPPEYKSLNHPRFAVRDVRGLEKVLESGLEHLVLWGPFRDPEEFYRLQFYSEKESYLNELMPYLENLDLCVIDEVDFSVRTGMKKLYIKSFAIRGGERKLSSLREGLVEALAAMRRGELENDYLNRLLISTGLSWKQIDVFRGYRNYYFQLGSPYTKKRVAYALINNPEVALLLYRYFEGRFCPEPRWEDPLRREEEALSPIRQELIGALTQVSDVNEDSILRILFNLIDSTVRTNFFIRSDRADYFFSFKISAIGIIDMPAPRPLFEVYVHSAKMEGIHLRGGKVARGGIRWSDRPDDFRTEILGLMKTQMTKNALIVPVGSKGGFIVKTPFATREEGGELSKAAYQTLMRGLLDLTDNRVGGEPVRPEGIVAYDEEDPYLVVAADKGTAHLPDTANAVSADYAFWLDDAFASGGSHGYDHKKLGITARGAWESVKRHFREMGHDTQAEPFTVVGIGDMSGDVFGNGMLLSPHIRLLAAFNHRHIFFDPDPDPGSSYRERQRLFDLPRSSWDDYDRGLISAGGGVYEREAKEIPLSPEVRSWLGVRHETMDAEGLIRLLLTAETDLLWNGGIGTYFKAGTEKNDEVGDRANDGVRVDATEIKARVVGEGGNLGFTQLGRIQYALSGGRLYTDAVDNSAGVDCSDHEVNLKIFMQLLSEKGEVASMQERDRRLEEVTDEVCSAVLANNYTQTLCISLDSERCAEDVEPFLGLSDRLSSAGLLDRRGEFLPTAKEVAARSSQSLSKPELAILMAYSKMQIYQALLESSLPEKDGAANFLRSYFPRKIVESFGEQIAAHPLAREIAATVITNKVVDQTGSTFIQKLTRETGASLVKAVETYIVFDRALDGEKLRREIFGLDNKMPAERQHLLLLSLEETLASLCFWALEHEWALELAEARVEEFKEKILAFGKTLGGILSEEEWGRCKASAATLQEEGLSAETAQQTAMLSYMEDFLPISGVVAETGADLYSVAGSFREVRAQLGLGDVLDLLEKVPARDKWDRLAGQSLRSGFASEGCNLTSAVLREGKGNLESYFSKRRQKLNYYRGLTEKMRGSKPSNYHPFMALLRALEGLLG